MDTQKTTPIIIDFEFTGLDNSYIRDNEIIQFKAMNMQTKQTVCKNYRSVKQLSAYCQLTHRVLRYEGDLFNKDEFIQALSEIGVNDFTNTTYTFYGYGTTTDGLMLKKIGVNIPITDIRKLIQLSKHEQQIATEGGNMETAFFVVTGKYPDLKSHDGIDELILLSELLENVLLLDQKEFLTVMPFGHCSGMPLSEYVIDYRKQADGYRLNNNDILSDSLTETIVELENEIQNQFHDIINDEHDGIDEE